MLGCILFHSKHIQNYRCIIILYKQSNIFIKENAVTINIPLKIKSLVLTFKAPANLKCKEEQSAIQTIN